VVNLQKIARKRFMMVFSSILSGEQHTKSRQKSGHRKWSNYDVKKMAANGKWMSQMYMTSLILLSKMSC